MDHTAKCLCSVNMFLLSAKYTLKLYIFRYILCLQHTISLIHRSIFLSWIYSQLQFMVRKLVKSLDNISPHRQLKLSLCHKKKLRGYNSLCHWRLTAHRSKGCGLRVNPTTGVISSSSSVTPGGGVKRKRWRRKLKKRKSSILAKLSPRHALRPAMQKCNKSIGDHIFTIVKHLW